ncbi:MAG: hypothetical protein Unbinned7913contig1002_42 [Prokaryotic dsDNA virus sp.]|jgi:restriction endonuclease S subunit|nr:hypothetical protein [Parcubacteria group bacterium]QDP51287.1 MAG: hypothetical protein Unbinned7913contig1002_42 [Prokaryotic dsDNA virus sp.]|tara:strand:+ start:4762 stop:4956 length:195 start_codon:yes stop_codon:yes gene_type:complete
MSIEDFLKLLDEKIAEKRSELESVPDMNIILRLQGAIAVLNELKQEPEIQEAFDEMNARKELEE